jgi:hypothetical protein
MAIMGLFKKWRKVERIVKTMHREKYLIIIVGMIGLFFCSKAIAVCHLNDPVQTTTTRYYVGPNGELTTTPPPPVLLGPIYFFPMPAPRVNRAAAPIVIKKETPPVPLYVQGANLRKAFGKISVSNNEEVNNAFNKSFDAQLAKIIHEYCQEQKKDILEMVGEEFLNKNAVVVSVQHIAADEYKKAIKSLSPKARIELSKLQRPSNPMDVNSSARFNPVGWQSMKYPVNPRYIVGQLDKLSADFNNLANIEAVRIFSSLKAEVLSSATANESVMPTEDVNSITKPEQFESTEAPTPLELPVSTITKTD